MNMKYEINKSVKIAVCSMLVAVLATASVLAQGVMTQITEKSGRKLTGPCRWLKASKIYIITVDRIDIKVSPSQVASVRVKEPSTLRDLLRKVPAASAVPGLKKIAKDYEMLQHDVAAIVGLAKCYAAQNNHSEVEKMCEQAIRSNPSLGQDDELAPVYWDALLALKKHSELEGALKKAIEQGSRPLAAIAQIKRGHIYRAQGNLKEANIDGYLRTILLYNRVKEVQPEAYYYSIKCFEELKQTAYADRLRKKMLAEFPRDPYTEKIKSGT